MENSCDFLKFGQPTKTKASLPIGLGHAKGFYQLMKRQVSFRAFKTDPAVVPVRPSTALQLSKGPGPH
jgi:hypothetical protein